ncbi:unnamed protein product [Rotaria sp. Silwood1]|nr:unnamed protein product [Rotaria sp. Silwood1]
MKMLAHYFVAIFLLSTINSNVYALKAYSRYQLWRLYVTNNEQGAKLLDFSHTAYQKNIDFWSNNYGTNMPIDVSIAPESINSFAEFLSSDDMKIKYDVIMKDIDAVIERQNLIHKLKPSSVFVDDFAYDKYHPIEEIHAWIDKMVKTYPKLATPFKVGKSYEKREMKGLKISSNKRAVKVDGTPVNKKKAVWWDGGIHAREWISSATIIYMVHALLSNYDKDPVITYFVDQFDYYILPVFNPDGYAYTWTNNRLYRKNRSNTSESGCIGVDLNRNWDYHWCEGGATHDPCSGTFCGSKPFSEIETAQVSRFISTHNGIFVHYINFHAYSQLWMSPWAYTLTKPEQFKLQDDGSAKAVQALRAVFGTEYEHGNIGSTIYIASGNAVDWTFGKANITFSYAVELRDTDQIVPTGKETLAGELALLRYIAGICYA